ncbi:hypothetical protein ILYODFUR_030766 [Ilyodon furcidens]|uniref:Uncharacterized protein n=1 Tax=Ilyodon furcidens TaxID=33524 RepID=A0ABV0V7H7_9TELE
MDGFGWGREGLSHSARIYHFEIFCGLACTEEESRSSDVVKVILGHLASSQGCDALASGIRLVAMWVRRIDGYRDAEIQAGVVTARIGAYAGFDLAVKCFDVFLCASLG